MRMAYDFLLRFRSSIGFGRVFDLLALHNAQPNPILALRRGMTRLRSPMLRAFLRIGAAAKAVVGGLRTGPSRAAERWQAWREERRSLAELARLNDRDLEDIGLRRIRASVGREVIIPILDDPRTTTARSATNDNARSEGTEVPTHRAA